MGALMLICAERFSDIAGILREIDKAHIARNALQGVCSTKRFFSILLSHIGDQVVIACIIREHGDEFCNALIRAQTPDHVRVIAASHLMSVSMISLGTWPAIIFPILLR